MFRLGTASQRRFVCPTSHAPTSAAATAPYADRLILGFVRIIMHYFIKNDPERNSPPRPLIIHTFVLIAYLDYFLQKCALSDRNTLHHNSVDILPRNPYACMIGERGGATRLHSKRPTGLWPCCDQPARRLTGDFGEEASGSLQSDRQDASSKA